jgi:hypothetical protein
MKRSRQWQGVFRACCLLIVGEVEKAEGIDSRVTQPAWQFVA